VGPPLRVLSASCLVPDALTVGGVLLRPALHPERIRNFPIPPSFIRTSCKDVGAWWATIIPPERRQLEFPIGDNSQALIFDSWRQQNIGDRQAGEEVVRLGESGTAAARAGMDAKTARKYRRLGRVPSQLTPENRWRTRGDPFHEVWGEGSSLLEVNPGLEGKTIFEYLQRRYAGRFGEGQLRTLQRRVKVWRATGRCSTRGLRQGDFNETPFARAPPRPAAGIATSIVMASQDGKRGWAGSGFVPGTQGRGRISPSLF
jgi:hypothetical protein